VVVIAAIAGGIAERSGVRLSALSWCWISDLTFFSRGSDGRRKSEDDDDDDAVVVVVAIALVDGCWFSSRR
jgi:hypothetical protein